MQFSIATAPRRDAGVTGQERCSFFRRVYRGLGLFGCIVGGIWRRIDLDIDFIGGDRTALVAALGGVFVSFPYRRETTGQRAEQNQRDNDQPQRRQYLDRGTIRRGRRAVAVGGVVARYD